MYFTGCKTTGKKPEKYIKAFAGFTCGINDEAILKQTAIRQSEQVIVLMDSSKIGVKCSFDVCGFEDIDVVVSDGKLPEDFLVLL